MFHNGPLPVGTKPRASGDLVYVPNSNDSLIVGLFSVNKDNTYALIVNGKHNEETISNIVFAVADGNLRVLNTDIDKFVPITGAVSVSEGTRANIRFAPGSGHLFHLRNPYSNGP